jgi:uncharacterized repeat protein (TIGR03803 family)
MLAGCGGSQPPIGAPGAMPQSQASAIAPARTGMQHVGTAPSYQVLFSFNRSDGWFPDASLIDVTGTLYGTTVGGGAYDNAGTVYSIGTTGTEQVLHSFRGGGDSYDPYDGASPAASLIDVNGTLYGTTESGGAYCEGNGSYGCGTVFSITTDGTERLLHSFGSGSDGANPAASLIDVNGTLYGTTAGGGAYGYGTAFSISTSGSEQVLHSFGSGYDGQNPGASLIDVKGTLYGTTVYGGTYGEGKLLISGTVFRITLAGAEQVLHSFGNGSDGQNPAASLIDMKGTLYGTTQYGGTGPCHYSGNTGCGTVFEVTTSGKETVLHSFADKPDGSYPVAGLIDVRGTLYGTTTEGGSGAGCNGSGGCGTVFSITTAGSEHVRHNFRRGDGVQPYASLVDFSGTVYGTTTAGGAYRSGTVFAWKP